MEKQKRNRIVRWVLILLFLLVGLGGCKTTAESEPNPESTEGDMTVHFLDVGQGLSILVQSDGENLIYDGGGSDASSFVVAYLKEQGVTTIDYLISSHYDEDHVSGLIGCLNAFSVKQVIGSDYVHDSKTYQSFRKAVQEQQLSVQHPAVGEEFAFGAGSFRILAPQTIEEKGSNDNSVVIKLMNRENSFLFTGDAEYGSEAAMCQSGMDLDCDVLVLSHHGSATATSWEFLEHTVPEYAVISCGQQNSYGHPHKDTMDKLEAMEIAVYRTDKQGTFVVESNGTDLEWSQEPCTDYTPGDESDQGTEKAAQKIPDQGETVWLSETGSKYHNKPDCGNMNPDNARQVSRSEAESMGYEACRNCYQ